MAACSCPPTCGATSRCSLATLLVDMTDGGMLVWTREVAANALQGLVSGSVPAATSLGGELRLMQRDEGITVERHSRGNASRSARVRG